MKAIETHYDGYRFRSRLEARWAYFFNKAGVRYEYEPEGFVVDGKPYLPDFYLPNTYLRNKETLGVYVEIKRDGGEFLHEKFSKPLVVFSESQSSIFGVATGVMVDIKFILIGMTICFFGYAKSAMQPK